MRFSVLLLLLLAGLGTNAQSDMEIHSEASDPNAKYFSFNPFGLLEGAMSIGPGFGNRFSERSEYFFELSYLTRNPLYDYANTLHGFRLISQYRYHFLQQWKPFFRLNTARRHRSSDQFAALEFRLKDYNFSNTNNFIKTASNDTLFNYPYEADAVCLGGALLFGTTRDIGPGGHWKVELSLGLGLKQKWVKFKNVPRNYQPLIVRAIDWGFPAIYESVSAPYVPLAIRFRYEIN